MRPAPDEVPVAPDLEDRVRRVEERLTPAMAWLGVVFAMLVAFELGADELSPATRSALTTAGWAIWGVFVAEFAVRLWLADRRLAFVRREWLSVVVLMVPLLRVLALLRLARLGRLLPAARVLSSGVRARGTARRLLRSRLGYLSGVGSIVVLGVAQLGYVFEGGASGETFSSFGDALLWAVAVVVALQGDPIPQSTAAHLVMLGGFGFGLVVIASVAGTVGAYLVEARGEREAG